MTRKKLIKKTRYFFLQMGLANLNPNKISYCRDLPNKKLTNEERWKILENMLKERGLL